MFAELRELYDEFKEARRAKQTTEARLQEARQQLEAALSLMPEWQNIQRLEARLAEDEAEDKRLYGEVREAAVNVWRKTGQTKPHPKVSVRVDRKLDYEQEVAVFWARDHGKHDWIKPAEIRPTPFKTAVLAMIDADLIDTMGLEFVTLTEEPVASVRT